MVYYISDLHFFHTNIIRYSNRPFNDLNEMKEELIHKWNKKVKKKDDVYILGDIFFNCKPCDEQYDILESLNGKKHWIIGNHDYKQELKDEKLLSYFEEVVYYKEVHDNKRKVILFHYPIESWNGRFKESVYHLYGHVHQNTMKHIYHRYNVSCEVIDYEPKTLDELIELNKENDRKAKVKDTFRIRHLKKRLHKLEDKK